MASQPLQLLSYPGLPALQEGKAYQAAVAAWCAACDQPRTAAEWQEEEARAHEVVCAWEGKGQAAVGAVSSGKGPARPRVAVQQGPGLPRRLTASSQLLANCLPLQVLKGFVADSQPHRAFRLWVALCAAAAQDAASPGSRGAVLSLLRAEPEPLMWRPDMALAAALAGACQDEIELGLPVEVHRTATASRVIVGEVMAVPNGARACWGHREQCVAPAAPACACLALSSLPCLMFCCPPWLHPSAGVRRAKVQLERAVQLFAWLHDVLGLPQPEYVGCVVVPCTLRVEASRFLGRSLAKEVEVPLGRGKVSVTWQLRVA